MGEIWRFTWHDLRRLLTSPRAYLALFVVYACLRLVYGEVGLYIAESGQALQGLELMIFASASGIPQKIMIFGILLLLGDAPFLHEGMSVYLVRSSRSKWFLGQLLFCLVTVVCYLLAVELMLLTMSGSGVTFRNQWSGPIELVSRIPNGEKLLHIKIDVDFPINILLSGRPWAMFGLTVFYDILLLTFFALTCLALNARFRTGVGCFAVVVLATTQTLILNSRWPWLALLSPCLLASLGRELVSPLSVAYRASFFLAACGLLSFWAYRVLRRADLGGGGGA